MTPNHDAILDRWANGESAGEIVAALKLPQKHAKEYVRNIVARARDKGDRRAKQRYRGVRYDARITAALSGNGRAGAAFREEAARRMLAPHELATMILVAVGEHDLFKAVLDD